MDIRLKSNLAKSSDVHSVERQPAPYQEHDDQSMGHSDEQGDMLANDQAKGELRDAWIQMEETSPENNVDETAYEVLHEKPGVHVQDKLGINPRNGLKTL